MSYRALGTKSPVKLNVERSELDLKTAALQFLRDTCEDLRFDNEKEKEEGKKGIRYGKSLREHQIPYNMQMDVDRLCLENAVNRFMDSGVAQDAFDVYFCYLEMFVGEYGKTQSMIELLSEFEDNAGSLLMKHRDHYSHSVYVFALGLAIYETNAYYRQAYQEFYGLKDQRKAAHHYLQYWGLASLFHDIGYPFELPFEQVASYFEIDRQDRARMPMIAYHGLDRYVTISEPVKRALARIYQDEGVIFQSTDQLFAYDIAKKLSSIYIFSKESLEEILKTKPTHPEYYNCFMDHAYFSATVLFKKIFEEMGSEITRASVDALTAIILHNSLYKFSIAFYKDPKLNRPLTPRLHPLAFMLMLCDELQCWDRISYGRNSRTELHPMGCCLTFCENGIQAVYQYDEAEKEKIMRFEKEYRKWEVSMPQEKGSKEYALWKKKKPTLKAYASMAFENEFQQDIEKIVDLSHISLHVKTALQKRENQHKKTYLSNSNFIHLYNFAVALNGRWERNEEWRTSKEHGKEAQFLRDHMEEFLQSFKNLSLEYKLSNINQAKAFAGYLDAIHCFYTDHPVDYELLKHFEPQEVKAIGAMEHYRWLLEHCEMGWRHGEPKSIDQREMERIHPDMMPEDWMEDGKITKEAAYRNYQRLDQAEKDKDTEPMNAMLKLLKLFDGLRIYRLNVK